MRRLVDGKGMERGRDGYGESGGDEVKRRAGRDLICSAERAGIRT